MSEVLNEINTDDYKVDIGKIVSSIVWTDLPIIGIALFHFVLLIISIYVRHRKVPRLIMFVMCLVLAISSEKIGMFVQENYSQLGFSSNYFDQHGIVYAILFALPPMFCAIILVSTQYGNLLARFLAARNQKKEENGQSKEHAE